MKSFLIFLVIISIQYTYSNKVDAEVKKGLCPNLAFAAKDTKYDTKPCKLDKDCSGEHKCCNNVCLAPCHVQTCQCSANTTVVHDLNNKGCPTCSCVDPLELAKQEREKNLPEACKQPKFTGPCRGSKKRFYYDSNTNKCGEFIYGGCQPNENNFEKLEDCEKKCVVVDTTDPCTLEKVPGPCIAAIPKFYYDKTTKKCEKFTYGGCKGNKNNFDKIEDCQKQCLKLNEKCLPKPEKGNCRAAQERFYYDVDNKKCDKFTYSGCGGNANNFKTKEECDKECHTTEIVKDTDKCFLDKKVGDCRGLLPRYYYNKETKKCDEFKYGGCGGNENNFIKKEDCEKDCELKLKAEAAKIDSICLQDKFVGPCRKAAPRFFYNKDTKACEEFKYGGCQGNDNNFVNKEECEKACNVKPPIQTAAMNMKVETPKAETVKLGEDVCSQPKVTGDCKALLPRYYYNKDTNRCEQFSYGGCGGNENNFKKLEDCEKKCDVCLQPKIVGDCRAMLPRLYFDVNTKKCEEFYYGGCGANGNHFKRPSECEKKCGHRMSPPK